MYPELGIVRFHAFDQEERNLKFSTVNSQKQEDSDVNEAQGELKAEYGEVLNEAKARAIVTFNQMVIKIMKDSTWRSNKKLRPNVKKMSLFIRACQLAGVATNDLPTPDFFQLNDAERQEYAEIREIIENKSGRDLDKKWVKGLKEKVASLLTETLRRAHVIVTTCNNSADQTLTQARKNTVLIVDEACQGTELEVILSLISNKKSIERVIFVGDFY